MDAVLYYFTGTGNSLAVAREFARQLGTTNIIGIPAALKDSTFNNPAGDTVGVVFPVYMHRPPHIVRKFVKQLSKINYFFAVAVNAGDAGGALNYIKQDLKQNPGAELDCAVSIKMPTNYILRGEAAGNGEREKLFSEMKRKIKEVSMLITYRKSFSDKPAGFFRRKIWPGMMYGAGYKFIPSMAKDFTVDESCTGCGICANVCPVENITIEDGKPIWAEHCEQCLACINLCPESSIQFGKKTVGKKRYHHPEVSVKDIISQKEVSP